MGTGDRAFYRLLLFLVILALPQPALAGKPIIVGDGTVVSCTETALKQALLVAETVGGGTIRFNWVPRPPPLL